MHVQEPFIETLHAHPKLFIAGGSYDALGYALKPLLKRSKDAKYIVEHIDEEDPPLGIYLAIENILCDYPRLALYLPFKLLEKAPPYFRDCYMYAWQECWNYEDYRELYNFGDIYTRKTSNGEPERIVKAMHLAPYLVKFKYITVDSLLDIMKYMRHKNLLRWSLMDAAEAMRSMSIINYSTYQQFKFFKLKTRPQPQCPPEVPYASEKHFELRNPAGPFAKNIDRKKILKQHPFRNDRYLLVGGARLKGYGDPDADYLIYEYDSKSESIVGMESAMNHPSVNAQLILDTVWIGADTLKTVEAQFRAAERCFSNPVLRAESLAHMEKDLLQFRLMYEGIPSAYPELFAKPKKKTPIDDNSAFYRDEYRTIATKLFVKYIVLPEKD